MKALTIPFLSKQQQKWMRKLIPFTVVLIFLPKTLLFFVICGLLDLKRNDPVTKQTVYEYFFGNGIWTWLLSPFNLLMDLIAKPNKLIYQLNQLPPDCVKEIQAIMARANQHDFTDALKAQMGDKKRGMIFFKWYNKNVDNDIKIDEFHQEYKYIKTIGVSIFNKKQSTNAHYGPLRITLRVLYNINSIENDNVYIKVGNVENVWHQQPLFIFDDTLFHQSFNESDQLRMCMFIDILRPSYCYPLMAYILKITRYLTLRINGMFYKKWETLK